MRNPAKYYDYGGKMLEKGTTFTLKKIVAPTETAKNYASGALDVFATPAMIGFMENTCFHLTEKELAEGETTVGISVNIRHLKATNVGEEVVCTAILTDIDGKKLTFDVKVTEGDVVVGEGTHERFIVNAQKFMDKLKK